MPSKNRNNLKPVRFTIIFFALAALLFSIISSDQLVLLARLSFSGTALMGPLILLGLFTHKPVGKSMIIASGIALSLFILSQLNIIPQSIMQIRVDLALFLLLGIGAVINFLMTQKQA